MKIYSIKKIFGVFVAGCVIFWVYLLLCRPSSLKKKPWEVPLELLTTEKWHQPLTTSTNTIKTVKDEKSENPNSGYNITRAVLIFTESENSKFLRKLKATLSSHRIYFDVLTWNRLDASELSPPRFIGEGGVLKYAAFIFDNVRIYDYLDRWTRYLLHDYCKRYGLGIVILSAIDYKRETNFMQLNSVPLWVKFSVKGLYDTELNPNSPVLKITKAGNVLRHAHRLKHTVFWSNHSTFEPVAYAYRDTDAIKDGFFPEKELDDKYVQTNVYRVNRSKFMTIIYDKGEIDGVRKVFFGGRVDSLWQYKLLFIDALATLSQGTLGSPLTRWILVDVDDIFVAHKGTRMKKGDVEALVKSQERLASKVPNFHYNLGFSGFYYKSGSADENEGDELLLKYAKKFWWFPHMYKHLKPHKFANKEELIESMKKNKAFAVEKGIPINSSYAISPHHSGVYPVHEELYEAWKAVWDIKVTSTEEYPHLYPAWRRRGFIHRDIMVLPRQTCGLFTQNLFFSNYPKGRQRLEKSIHGGELFMTIVSNLINVFMTHFGNYGNDRLAPYTFETVIDFIQKWTNLQLVTEKPLFIGKKYFDVWPADAMPIWQNPCNDSRHLNIWSPSKSCQQLPKFLIVGPQKTGTAALQAFLSLHPSLVNSRYSRRFYEEIQFFNNEANYRKGVDWYMSYFPEMNHTKDKIYFEKSANYFDSKHGSYRVSSLLPNAKIIIIAGDPALRAYSWYQHVLSKKKSIAVGHTFHDVITGNHNITKLEVLKRRCLFPGKYAIHLERWFSYYPPEKIHVVDGDVLKKDPAKALTAIQKFLEIKPFDFKAHITFDKGKGFFCPLKKSGGVRCLGASKGRNYPRMDLQSETFLRQYYRLHNLRFAQLLTKYRKPLPKWLKKQKDEVD